MIPPNFKPEWIRKLNEIGKKLENVNVRIPAQTVQQQDKQTIEQILPPANGNPIKMDYVWHVLFAIQYLKANPDKLKALEISDDDMKQAILACKED